MALSPVAVEFAREVTRRIRGTSSGADGGDVEGPLAPVSEVPRSEYDELLNVLAQNEEAVSDLQRHIAQQDRQHALERRTWREERRELEQEIARREERLEVEAERVQARYEQQVAHLRGRVEDEMRGRIRAETLLASLQAKEARGE